MTRGRMVEWALACGLTASLLGLAIPTEPTEAIEGGSSASDLGPSVVRLVARGREQCTGSVVGDGWILTAAHCFTNGVKWSEFTLELWQNGTVGKGTVFRSKIARAPLTRSGTRTPTSNNTGWSDVALVATSAMPTWAKTIPMALTWPASGTKLTQYGYGRTKRANDDGSATLQKTPNGDLERVSCDRVARSYKWTTGHLCTEGRKSTAWPGDSGGPLLWWVNGYWQQVGDFSVFPGNTSGIHWNAYWSTADSATRAWIASVVTGLVSPNTIVRDEASGAAWLYLGDGYRHWIPDGGTYNCLVGQAVPVANWSLRRIETIPDMVGSNGWARCTTTPTPPPPPPPATWTEQQGSHGVNTFTNYHNASGVGPRIEPMAYVQVSCKVYDPFIASVNPDGYWYRIASAPWNNSYYAPANTFWNGDVPGQTPYTHNTDWAVPNC